jgi:hypothetical protein
VLFKVHMNNDLRVKEAFDAVRTLLRDIEENDKQNPLSKAQRSKLRQELEDIDTVLGVLFPR